MGKDYEIGEGGVDVFACKNRKWWDVKIWHCGCGRCTVCGYTLHSAVHAHAHGGHIGDKPFGHRFVPKDPDHA